MDHPSHAFAELDALAWSWANGPSTPEQVDRIETLLLESDDARRRFGLYMHLQAVIERMGEGKGTLASLPLELPAGPIAPAAPRRIRLRAWHLAASVMAAGLVYGLYVVGISWGMLEGRGERLEARGARDEARGARDEARGARDEARGARGSEVSDLAPRASSLAPSASDLAPRASSLAPPASAVATVTAERDAEWSDPAHKSAIGNRQSAIAKGEPLELAAGIVQLQLKQGVTLHIEGPARWSIDGANNATLARGKLVAHVPKQAIGFTLETPYGSIIDLGTEFGVEVDEQGMAGVHVLQGVVNVKSAIGPTQGKTSTVTAGHSVQMTSKGFAMPVETTAALDTFQRLVDAVNEQDSTAPIAPEINESAIEQLAGLRLWLRADRGITLDAEQRVERWADQSGHGFDAVQAEPSQRPVVGRDTGESALPRVMFDGQRAFLECTSSLAIPGDGDLTIALVLRLPKEFANYMGIFSLRSHTGTDWNSPDGLAILQSAQPFPFAVMVHRNTVNYLRKDLDAQQLVLLAQTPPEELMSLLLTKSGTSAFLWINGRLEGTDLYQPAVTPLLGNKDHGYCLGVRSDDGQMGPGYHDFGQSEIHEVMVFDRALDGAELRTINQYLHDYQR